jgi:tetratricopeptide (TPR) repeat protein
MAFLCFVGMFGLLARRRDPIARGLGWSVLAVALAVCAFFVTARFRVPVAPLLALLGGAGIAEFAAATGIGGVAPGPARLALPAIGSALFAALLVFNLSGLRAPASDGQSHFRLGLILERQQKPAEAMRAYEEALALDPTLGKAEVNLGTLLARAGKLDEARVHLERGVARDPLSAVGMTNLGQVAQLQGRVDEALALYARALQVEPGNTEARRSAAQALQAAGRTEDARRVLGGGPLTPPSTPVPVPRPDPSARP